MSEDRHHNTAHDPPRASWREWLLRSMLVSVWLILAGRLVFLQMIQGPRLRQQVEKQWAAHEVLPARPGDITDRNGRLLATTVSVRSLFVVPARIEQRWQFAAQLADALGRDRDGVFQRISAHGDKQFLWMARRLTDEQAAVIRDLDLPRDCFGFRDEFLRVYPQGEIAAQVLGIRDIDGIGRGGLEEHLNEALRGRDGRRSVARDARGHVVEVSERITRPPQHGQTVRLTLDAVIQLHAQRALQKVMQDWKPKSACAIVLEPQTGGVLAMANCPTFDPNQLDNVPDEAWKNHAIASIYEPGSTFKPFIVAAAIEQGLIQPDEMFDCEHGEYRMGRRVLHDHHGYGELSVTDILVKSSNIGMAKIGERLTNPGIYATAVKFGFGRKTGIELPGELKGMLRPLRKWNSYSTGSVPMGQEIAVTPLQLISATAGLANGGRQCTPHLVENQRSGIAGPATVIVSQTVDANVADWIVQGPMTEVVRRGTGRNAKSKDYTVFGKTGTAQKPDPQTGAYSNQLHVSSFICGAPAENPQALVLVVVDEPSVGPNHYGGTIAAPAAAQILKKTLEQMREREVELATQPRQYR
ncbi:penicillin-binding protein 2 [Symmachiella dynata]|uniref:peptidoglycan D,D-transpeptidase FtsI family protein n=1 Tax=Symmachiella dynata TaxID=2527995 RepID=UPI0030EC186C